MELTLEQQRRYWETCFPDQKIPAREKLAVRCDLHDDRTASCTLFLTGNGGYNCHVCGGGNIFQHESRRSGCTVQEAEFKVAEITGAKVSSPLGDLGPPVAFHDYPNENGIALYQKRKYEPELGKKTFRVFRSTDRGMVSGIDPSHGAPTRRVLYNLPRLVTANVVFHCEGEKDCDNLATANLFAQAGYSIACTTSFDGAWQKGHSPKWLDIYNPYYTGKIVFIFADNDEPGRIYAEHVAACVSKYAYKVRVISFPELPEHGDVSDYLQSHSVMELEEKIKATSDWEGQPTERENWLVEAVEWSMSASPEMAYLIDGVIQRDANGIIAAEPKTGKSLCALDMLISMACGTKWLGRRVPQRIRTAYISREDSPTLTKARIVGLLRGKGVYDSVGYGVVQDIVDPEGWLWCNTREQLGEWSIDNDEHLKNMAHDLKERGCEFAVIDVFNRIHNRAENDNAEMAAVFERISQMGRDANCSMGVVHHVSKENTSGRFFTRIRGASSIYGWTEWSIGLTITNPNDEGQKLIRKAEFETKAGVECPPITFTFETGRDGNLRLELTSTYASHNGHYR